MPGYDRHFALFEEMGINMISVPLTGKGPNMDKVEEIVAKDKSVRELSVFLSTQIQLAKHILKKQLLD